MLAEKGDPLNAKNKTFTILGVGICSLAAVAELSSRGAWVTLLDAAGPLGEHARPSHSRNIFLAVTRAHWAIEHSLHWVLDVTMNEDQARNRKEKGPENLAIMRRVALNLARAEKSKGSMRGKLKKAGWHNPFMLDLIRAAFHVQKR